MEPILQKVKQYIPPRAKKILKKTASSAKRSYRSIFFARAEKKEFSKQYFAEHPVAISTLGELRAEKFPQSGPVPWLDRTDAESLIQNKVKSQVITPDEAVLCQHWAQDGYIIFKNVFDSKYLDHVWAAYEAKVQEGTIPLKPESMSKDDPHPGRWLNPHMLCKEIREVWSNPQLLKYIDLLLGVDCAPFQTITSHKGSQQLPHSDSIHMTTYPQGFMCASWIAFEDIHPDSGPLVYYPGSHKLPYYYSKDVNIEEGQFKLKQYAIYHEKYEPFIQNLIQKHELSPKYFQAKKGDVLLWHANLLHGGSPRKVVSLSRKALVCHYFAKKAFCYHDLAGNAAVSGARDSYL